MFMLKISYEYLHNETFKMNPTKSKLFQKVRNELCSNILKRNITTIILTKFNTHANNV